MYNESPALQSLTSTSLNQPSSGMVPWVVVRYPTLVKRTCECRVLVSRPQVTQVTTGEIDRFYEG